VTRGIPERPPLTPPGPLRTTPTARISRGALTINLRAVITSTPGAIIDVRADAWGHGAQVVAPLALDAGAVALLVDAAGEAGLLELTGHRRLVTEGEGTSPEAVYGLTPGFTPVMSLNGRVLALKRLLAGEGVSYGYAHRAPHDTTVALVTGGYAQGVVRALGNVVSVTIAGRRHPIIGRVAMDVCVVDVGAGEVASGAEAMFFGDPAHGAPALGEWTAATGMTPGELVAAVGLGNVREYTA
jgi:alanine racemase